MDADFSDVYRRDSDANFKDEWMFFTGQTGKDNRGIKVDEPCWVLYDVNQNAEETAKDYVAGVSNKEHTNQFVRNGEIWTVTFQGKRASFGDHQYIRLIAHLIDNPHTFFTDVKLNEACTGNSDPPVKLNAVLVDDAIDVIDSGMMDEQREGAEIHSLSLEEMGSQHDKEGLRLSGGTESKDITLLLGMGRKLLSKLLTNEENNLSSLPKAQNDFKQYLKYARGEGLLVRRSGKELKYNVVPVLTPDVERARGRIKSKIRAARKEFKNHLPEFEKYFFNKSTLRRSGGAYAYDPPLDPPPISLTVLF